jgi:2-succinyl-5-enolpyruvyl-6-hydroxy-3-cyclohexene-1-carboxylate synthase
VAEVACRVALAADRPPELLELGGPEALSQREVVRVYERLTSRTFVIEEISRAVLERRHRSSADPTAASLAALMLEADDGAVTEMGPVLALYPLRLTTVAEFAAGGLL